MAKIDIVITIHPEARLDWLWDASRSLGNQGEEDFRLILFQDGCRADRARAMFSFGPQLLNLRTENRIGRISALIRATKHVTAPFFGLLDADDELEPGCLSATLSALENDPSMGMVYTHHARVDEEGNHLPGPSIDDLQYKDGFLEQGMIGHHFRLMRTETFLKAGGWNPDYPVAMDYELILRMEEKAKVVYVPETLYSWRRHPDQISATSKPLQEKYGIQAKAEARHRRALAEKKKAALATP